MTPPLWNDRREETKFTLDDLGIKIDHACAELKADYEKYGLDKMRGLVTAALFLGPAGFELCGSQLGSGSGVTLMLAMLLHSELHNAGIRGGVTCMVLDSLEEELRARIEATL